MKLNEAVLKRLIRETIRENSMILSESLGGSYTELLEKLQGRDSSISSIGIMSGQYPMAQDTSSAEVEEQRAQELNQKLNQLGMEYVKILGNYEDIPEKSVVIKNPSMQDMEALSLEFVQESYVWGVREGEVLSYELRKVDHENGSSSMYPGSKKASVVLQHEDLQDASTNYSEFQGMRFGFELF